MKNLSLAASTLLLCVLSIGAAPQRVHMSPPPAPMDPDRPKEQSDQPTVGKYYVDLAKLQKEADTLARTAQTIPTDVASVRKGTLPKDVIEKLKQIEKLSKHLRSELNP